MSDRGFIEWKPNADSKELMEHILTVVHYYRDNDFPAPTVRDIYYDLLGMYGESHGYVKGKSFQRRVYRLLSKMRRAGMVEFSEITDDSFDTLVRATHIDPEAFWFYVEDEAYAYHKDLARNQPKRVIIYTEGAGAVQQFYEVAKDYTIPVYSPGGWDSLTLKHDTAEAAVGEYQYTERPTVILHAGDLDPDGVDLFRCFTEDVHAFVEGFCEEESIINVGPEGVAH